jgi:formylglycine-generating enzyme
MNKKILRLALPAFIFSSLLFTSCQKERSSSTGWAYNDKNWGGFEKVNYMGQETGPGLVFIEGGTFTMGSFEQDLVFETKNIKRRITVHSFYMDEHEVTNLQYLEYLHWLARIYQSYPQVHTAALPDTLCWRDKLAYNEPFVSYYLRHPGYQDYPVVGVSWLQATAFAAWRTDRVNEMILIREGILQLEGIKDQADENNFNTDAYLLSQFDGQPGKQLKDYTPNSGGGTRRVRMEDGILLPVYRLPTEAEWEFAAYSYKSEVYNENIDVRKVYPWTGLTVRKSVPEKDRGFMWANFKRGKGDNAGVPGHLNDQGFITMPVQSYWPNDYGLYHMAGNVSEWVMDVYRPLSIEDMTDFQPYRGNVYMTKEVDSDGNIAEKDSLGRIRYKIADEDENSKRRNYKKGNNIGEKDEEEYMGGEQKYDYGKASLVNNKAHVVKGGSWNDRAYWMSPGTRRFLDEEQSLSWLGFRCAMDRVGDPVKD